MNPFKAIKAWFMFPEYRDSLAELVAYLPVGDLESLLMWAKKWIPYKHDVDAQGKYDPLQNYNGADLTIKAKGGDCESIAAVFSEVVRLWQGWESNHVCMVYTDDTAHDVAVFRDPHGKQGWIDGQIYYGGYAAMKEFYTSRGWYIADWWVASDIGEKLKQL